MAARIGAGAASKFYIGGTPVSKLYVGNTLVWQAIATAVLFDAASPGTARNNTTGNSVIATGTVTVGSGTKRRMLVWVALAHNLWLNSLANYGNSVFASSHLDGALTLLQSVWVGSSGQRQGSLHLFEKQNPTVGAHTITAGVTAATQAVNCAQFVGGVWQNVASLTAAALQTTDGTNGTLNMTIGAGGAGDAAVCGFAQNLVPAGLNHTQRGTTIGGSTTGDTDYVALMEADGSVSETFTTSSSGRTCGIAARLVLAP